MKYNLKIRNKDTNNNIETIITIIMKNKDNNNEEITNTSLTTNYLEINLMLQDTISIIYRLSCN